MGARHLRVLREAGVHVIAVPRRPERADVLARDGYETARSPREAAERGARLAIIATNTARHAEDAIAALQAGLDVLVEKPLARDAAEGDRIARAAGAAGRRVWVGNVMRFSEALLAFRRHLPEIGAVHAMRVECLSYLPDWRPDRDYRQSYAARAEEGGVLRDLIHEVDYAGWLFGWPEQVWATLRNLGRLGIAAEETADLLWESRGCLVTIALDYLTRPTRRGARAVGELGTLEWNSVEGTVTVVRGDWPPRTERYPQTRDEMVRAQDLAVIAAQRGTVDERLAGAAEGVRALAVADAARRAGRTGAQEIVRYDD